MNQTVGARIKQALQAAEMSQADLAKNVGTTQTSVSAWVADRKPPKIDNVKAIAEALNVEPGWLQFGTGRAPRRNSVVERDEYMEVLQWYWQPPPPDQQRVMGDPAGHAFQLKPETLVRESGQNTLDELLGETVELEYTIIELAGEDATRFLEVLQYDTELRGHLEACAKESKRKHAAVIASGLKHLEDDGVLRLIRIADYGAHGLTGPEFESGRFMAVCRNTLDSFKGESAGGSYGLGKATMWTASWMGVVVMNSQLSVPEGEIEDDRFFVRAELPWHEDEGGQPYNGPGWLGRYDNEHDCTVSYGGNGTLARDLYVDRDRNDLPGTTFLIVGAYDPSGEQEEDLDSLAASLREAVAENFWAAMVPRGKEKPRLRAVVRTQRGHDLLSEQVVDPADYVRPMVETLEKFYDGDVVEELSETGDVIEKKVTLKIPARVELGPHDPLEHEATLLIAQTDLPPDDSSVNRVVYLRGNNMTIRDFPLRSLPLGARQFHAVLLAGEADGKEVEDRQGERFLRAAEPPAHDKWTGTTELTTRYKRGGASAIREFEQAIANEIREAIRDRGGGANDGPEPLKELLRLNPPKETQKKPKVKKVNADLRGDGTWEIEGIVSVPSDTRWSFAPELRFGTESGPTIGVDWGELKAGDRCELIDGRLVTEPGARTVSFKAVSDPASYPVKAHRARVKVDLRRVRRVAEGGS